MTTNTFVFIIFLFISNLLHSENPITQTKIPEDSISIVCSSYVFRLTSYIWLIPMGISEQLGKMKHVYEGTTRNQPFNPAVSCTGVFNAVYQVVVLDGFGNLISALPQQVKLAFSKETPGDKRGETLADLTVEIVPLFIGGSGLAGLTKTQIKKVPTYYIRECGMEVCVEEGAISSISLSSKWISQLENFTMGMMGGTLSATVATEGSNLIAQEVLTTIDRMFETFKKDLGDMTSISYLTPRIQKYFLEVDDWINGLSKQELEAYLVKEFDQHIQSKTFRNSEGVVTQEGSLWGLESKHGTTIDVLFSYDKRDRILFNLKQSDQFGRTILEDLLKEDVFNSRQVLMAGKSLVADYPRIRAIERYVSTPSYRIKSFVHYLHERSWKGIYTDVRKRLKSTPSYIVDE